ncbi:MAG: CHAT domain-containing protein, partial [Anaerolineae bacterium]|nr:CHAT domain-containing protein [Anaerolineae bacterium]
MPTLVAPNPFIIRPPADLLHRYPQLRHAAADLARLYAHSYLVTDDLLQQVGSQLWAVLDIAGPLAAARQQAGRAVLPLILASDDAGVQLLPWETLYHPEFGFLARAEPFTFSRHLPGLSSQQPPLEPGPLRVLLFTSLPDDVDPEKGRLDVEEEQAQILEALAPWQAQGVVDLLMPDDGRFATLKELLLTFDPHLLFLSGHGRFVQPDIRGQAPGSYFLFEDEHGHSQPVDEQTLAAIFVGRRVECVVLSACELGKGSSDNLAAGLTWRLHQAGIPHLVGMRESVLDRAGTLFARAFMDAIARQERLDVAVQAGRRAITTPLAGLSRHTGASGLAEHSLGQWCLPLCVSQDQARPLITWEFTPRPPQPRQINETLSSIILPPRFIGRRSELRQLKSRLGRGQLRQLLITGPGGQGKTALAGRLAHDLQRQGYLVAAYAARPENEWAEFQMELEMELNGDNRQRYNLRGLRCRTEQERAALLLELLLRQQEGRLLLFLDNLETVQDGATQSLTDARLVAWIAAAQSLTGQGLLLLLTSRWRLPGWPEADHWPLAHSSYGDFLRLAQEHLPPRWLQQRERLAQVYALLHGNGRGLTFFAGAVAAAGELDEEEFLARLAQAKGETQTDMALATIVAHLVPAARDLLYRLTAYQTPVPQEGIIKIGLDLPQPERLLARLLAVSLVEQTAAPAWQTVEYQLSPLVMDWLGSPPPELAGGVHEAIQLAAAYQLYLFHEERPTLAQAAAAHQALRQANQLEAADRFALAYIVGPLNRRGLYQTLLEVWLPSISASDNWAIKAEALGQMGKQYLHLGSFDDALPFFERSLQISQAIGDKAGEGT